MVRTLDIQYHQNRKKRIDYIYRLDKRTFELKKIIVKFFNNYSKLKLLDIGTADGLVLSKLNRIFKFKKTIGIDMSKDLLDANNDTDIDLEIGNAENLRFKDASFDIITASAVIEHLNNPEKMLSECYRVLNDKGILILTTPNPFHNRIAEAIGYFDRDLHIHTFNTSELKRMIRNKGFVIILSKEFMLFPFFKIPFENSLENFLRSIGLGRLMCNQLVVGRK